MKESLFDVIIVGGSYAGLSAAMALGRSLRKVLVLDSGQPCNRQTPHSHNFITQDGVPPAVIATHAKEQVLRYPTVRWQEGKAVTAAKTDNGFLVGTEQGQSFTTSKIIFATGLRDIMPPIEGFAECWGISVLHCPYCHGYEISGEKIGLLGNGDLGFEFCRLLSNWSKQLTLFTNGASTLTAEQTQKLAQHKIEIIETEVAALQHNKGYLQQVVLEDGSTHSIAAVFARPVHEQHCRLPFDLGCEAVDNTYVKVDGFGRTTVPGVYAAGDCTSPMRAVSVAVAAGTTAASFLNRELIEENF